MLEAVLLSVPTELRWVSQKVHFGVNVWDSTDHSAQFPHGIRPRRGWSCCLHWEATKLMESWLSFVEPIYLSTCSSMSLGSTILQHTLRFVINHSCICSPTFFQVQDVPCARGQKCRHEPGVALSNKWTGGHCKQGNSSIRWPGESIKGRRLVLPESGAQHQERV